MYWYFDLERVPDLSLTKYMSLDESGVDGVLKKHASFLRQLNRKGLLSRVFFHLLYRYDPDRASGEKLSVSLIAGGEPAALLHTRELIQSSAVSPYYDIISSERACVLEAVPGEGGLLLTVENHLGFRSVDRLEGGTVCKGSFFQGKKPAEAFRDGSFRNQVFSIRVLGERLLELDSSCQVGPDGLKMDARRYGFRSVLSKREFFAFLRASELRRKLWEGISRRCPECSSGYEAFTQEMASWNLKPLLVGLFQGGQPAPAEEP